MENNQVYRIQIPDNESQKVKSRVNGQAVGEGRTNAIMKSPESLEPVHSVTAASENITMPH